MSVNIKVPFLWVCCVVKILEQISESFAADFKSTSAHIKNTLKVALFSIMNGIEKLYSAYRQIIAVHNEKIK